VARIYVLERDNTVAKLRERVGQLRGAKAIGSERIVTAYKDGKRAPEHDVYKPVFRNPSPGELAEAEATQRKADALAEQQHSELEQSIRDNPDDPDLFRLLAQRPLDNNRPWEPQWRETERLLRYAILLDPTDWRLQLDRAANWNALGDKKLEMVSAEAQAVLRKNRDGDFNYIYDQERQKFEDDVFTGYVFALQAVRRDPASPFSNQRLAMAMQRLILHTINHVPIMPDAFQQAVLQMKLTYYAALRHLDHPEDWRDADTKGYTLQLLDWTKRQIANIPAKPPQ
jgi:hypothetical protein